MKRQNAQEQNSVPGSINPGVNVLLINASSRSQDSVTRHLTDELLEQIRQHYGVSQLTIRDVAASPLPVIDESWIAANFTNPAERNDAHNSSLAESNALVKELMLADVIILGVPIYNFTIPAALKAWIDLVARAGLTFRYTSDGPVGLLEGKKAFVAVASGGVEIDSAIDFATPYLRHVLGFIGIRDVEVIAAERLNVDSDAGRQRAEKQIVDAVSTFKQNTNAA